jgi:hypothetical protein
MKKRDVSKLQLSLTTETLRKLDEVQLAQIAGGRTIEKTCAATSACGNCPTDACYTWDFC